MKENFNFLRKPEILILGFSSIVSGVGNWITMMAILSLVIFQGDGGVAESSGIFMAGLLPIMLASPFAGRLADRYDRKRLMMISEFGAGATIAIIIFTEKLWLIYLAMALQALFVALMNPARQSALPQLVHDPHELERVNAFFQQLNSILKIVAPMVAGFLLTIMNAHQAIIVDIISFGISVVILSRLPRLLPGGIGRLSRWGGREDDAEGELPRPGPLDSTRGPEKSELPRAGLLDTSTELGTSSTRGPAEGVLPRVEISSSHLDKLDSRLSRWGGREDNSESVLPRPGPLDSTRGPDSKREPAKNDALLYLKESHALRLLFVSSFLCILIIVGFDILGSVYIRDVLHGDESFLGLMISLIGVGSFVTTLLVVLRKSEQRNWPDLALGVFLLAVLPLGMALGYIITNPSAVKGLIIASCLIGGFGNGFLMIQVTTILQITTPQQILGRLSGYLETTIIGGQLFSVVMLPLFVPAIIQPLIYFLGATVALLVVSALIALQSRSIRKENPPERLVVKPSEEVLQ